MKVIHRTTVNSAFSLIKNKFNKDLFFKLRPPFIRLEILRFDGCKKNDEVHLKISLFFFEHKWISNITDEYLDDKTWYFVDESYLLPFPLVAWKHKHIVRSIGVGKSEISDEIEFKTTNKLFDLIHYPIFYFMFYLRKPIYKQIFDQK